MADQPVTLAILEQFYREVMLRDFERVGEQVMAAAAERSVRFDIRAATSWLDSLDWDDWFLGCGVRRLERRLDDIHVLLERPPGVEVARRLEDCGFQYRQLFDGLGRLEGRLPHLDDLIGRLSAASDRDSLRAASGALRRDANGLMDSLRICRRRIDTYVRRTGRVPAILRL